MHYPTLYPTLAVTQPRPAMQSQTAPPKPLSMEELESRVAEADPSTKKQILGENLFPKVQALASAKAGKITGMLLEMDHADVVESIYNPSALKAGVEEALRILAKSETKAASQKVADKSK